MRLGPGDEVTLLDGSGEEFTARVQHVGRTEVALAVLSRRAVDREPPVSIVLGVALPKGERQKWLVEKAVELGVARLVPLRSARSVAQPVRQALGRLERAVIEASKQCGRTRLLQIDEPQDWGDFVSAADTTTLRLVATPVRKAFPPSAPRGPDRACRGPLFLAVGPEGGLTTEEVSQAAAAGWQVVDLGPRTLRVETAALALAAWAMTSA